MIVTILKELNLLQDLRLSLSHLREHKFKHSFQDTINPLCKCGQDIESSTHCFLHCLFFINEKHTLLSTIRSLDRKLSTDYDLTQTLLFGITSQISSNNFKTINASIDYIFSGKRFDEPLFYEFFNCKLEFSQQFSFLYIIILFVLFNYLSNLVFLLFSRTFQYIGIWRSCNFLCLFFLSIFNVK